MGHITEPPPTPPQARGAVRLSHKAYKAFKTYKSYMTYKSYKTYKPSPLRGTEGGYQYDSYYQPIPAPSPSDRYAAAARRDYFNEPKFVYISLLL